MWIFKERCTTISDILDIVPFTRNGRRTIFISILSKNDGINHLVLSCFNFAQHDAMLACHTERSRSVKVDSQTKITTQY